ncbi:hypothetical protein SK128_024219, partial [Halocaridina rubra]
IRHIKAAVRLTHLMLQCSCEVTKLLLNRNIVEKLHKLYYQPHMALSIKLLILKTLDAIIRTPLGLKYFVGKADEEGDKRDKNCYELVFEMLSGLKQTRAK